MLLDWIIDTRAPVRDVSGDVREDLHAQTHSIREIKRDAALIL